MARGNLHSDVMEAIDHAASGARVARADAEPKKASEVRRQGFEPRTR